ncbi:CLUMA_CG019217, isoform A [Clunio marinus]|uniref:CLUMA_CG019217, isoform A n=1 Tax=Clunio marinus TaxID=568069 RepID=A0A1J1J5T2_9DIPT|nr:CLUMA_CG019217, isoform A [Clunio marinus]
MDGNELNIMVTTLNNEQREASVSVESSFIIIEVVQMPNMNMNSTLDCINICKVKSNNSNIILKTIDSCNNLNSLDCLLETEVLTNEQEMREDKEQEEV